MKSLRPYKFLSSLGFMARWKKFLIIPVIGTSLFVILSYAHPAWAGEVDKIAQPNFWLMILSTIALWIATLFLKVSLFFLSFILEIASYNGYLNATAVEVGWVMVRDLTNMFFVVALLIIAFGTILGLEQYEWKKLLVKFVIAAILVNFSRVIVGVLIDISQIIMTTFVNGIAATAAGNVINGFNMDDITKLHSETDPALISPGIFTASFAAVVFAGMVMMTLGIFLFMLLARVIRLWILIVLSPLAFVLNVIPSTQNFANQWWTELGDDLVTGPVLLFFIWLSFVTIGTGQVNQQEIAPYSSQAIQSDEALDAVAVGDQQVGIGDAMGWNKMANFAIAIGMLLAGARVAQTIGGSSGSALTRVSDFGKKVATIASGYAVGRWAVGKGADLGKSGLKKAAGWAAYNMPAVGGKYWQRWGKRVKSDFDAWRHDTGFGPKQKWDEANKKWVYETKKTKEQRKDKAGKLMFDKQGKPIMEEKEELIYEEHKRGRAQRMFHWAARGDIASEKKLEKTEALAKLMRENAKADIAGIPTGPFFSSGLPDAFDRVMQGRIAIKKARSTAKTDEWSKKGQLLEAEQPRVRIKDGKLMAPKIGEGGKPERLIDEIVAHEEGAKNADEAMKALKEAARASHMQTTRGQEQLKVRGILKGKIELATKEQDRTVARQEFLARQSKEGLKDIAQAIRAEKEAKLEKGNIEELQKKRERELMTGAAGKKISAEEARQKITKGLEEARIKKATAGAGAEVAQAMKGELKETIKAERGAHLADTKVEAIKKEQEASFLGSAEGRDELKEEAQLKAKIATAQSKVKTLEAQQKTAFEKGTPEGKSLLEQRKLAELELQAAEKEYTSFENQTKREQMKGGLGGRGAAALAAATKWEQRGARGAAEEKKLTEEAKAKFVAPGAAGERLLKEQKEFEIESGLAQAKVKGAEEKAKLGATVSRGAQVQLTKEQEIETTRLAALSKELEESERRQAVDAKQKEVAETKQAEIRTAAEKAEIDKMEEQAKEKATKAEAVPGGALERMEKAKLEKQTLGEEIKEIEKKAAQAAAVALPSLIERLNLAEQGAKAAEGFIKNIREEELQKKFAKAAQTIEGIINDATLKGDAEAIAKVMKARAQADNYLLAMQQGEEGKEIAKAKGVAERQSVDAAHDALIGLGQGGRTISTAMGELGEKEVKEYSVLERPQAMKLAADRMAYLHKKRREKRAKNPNEDLGLSDKVALKGAMDFIDSEAWNDDIADQVFSEIARLEKGEIKADSVEGRKAQALKEFFTDKQDGLGWEYEYDAATKKFKVKDGYGPQMSGDLQIYASLGGDIEAVKTHRKIEARQQEISKDKEQTVRQQLAKTRDDRHKQAIQNATSEIDEDAIDEEVTKEEYVKISSKYLTDVQRKAVATDLKRQGKDARDPAAIKESIERQFGASAEGQGIQREFEQKTEERKNQVIAEMADQQVNYEDESEIKKTLEGVSTYDDIVEKEMGAMPAAQAQANFGMTKDEYVRRLRTNQDFMQTSARIYKKHALDNGHLESGSHIAYSGTFQGGLLRPATVAEAQADIVAEAVKRGQSTLVKSQFHSLGQMNLNTHLLDTVDESMYRTMYGSIAHDYEIKEMPIRTLLRLMGLATEERAVLSRGRLKIGGTQMDKSHARGSIERGTHIIKNLLLPQLLGNSRSFLFSLKRLGNHLKTNEMSKGMIKIDVDHFGQVDSIASLVKIIEADKGRFDVDDLTMARLKQIVEEYKRGVDLGTGSNAGRKAA